MVKKFCQEKEINWIGTPKQDILRVMRTQEIYYSI